MRYFSYIANKLAMKGLFMSTKTSDISKAKKEAIKKLTFFTAPIIAYWGSEPEEFTFLVGYSQFEPNKVNDNGERQLTVSFVQGKKQNYSIGKAYSYSLDMEFIVETIDFKNSNFCLDAGARLTVKSKDMQDLMRQAVAVLAKKKIQIPIMF